MRITFTSDKSPSKKIEFDGNIQERTIIHNHSIQRTLGGLAHSFHNGYYNSYTVTIDKINKKHKHLLIDIILGPVNISTNNKENYYKLALTSSSSLDFVSEDEKNYSLTLTFENKMLDNNN